MTTLAVLIFEMAELPFITYLPGHNVVKDANTSQMIVLHILKLIEIRICTVTNGTNRIDKKSA